MSDDRKYVRVYHDDLIRDYPEIYDDDPALAAWLRLLVIADTMWPTAPELPRSVKARPLARLTSIGLVLVLPRHRFRIRGLDAERIRRADAGRNAAVKRWHGKGNAGGNAEPMPRRDETRRDETEPNAREGLPNLTTEAIHALEERTGRTWGQAGEKQLTEYDRLIEDHGLEKVLSAMDRLMTDGKPMTARQLVWGAMKVLEPMLDPRDAAKAERQEEVERDSRRGVEATQRYLRELRATGERSPA
jgi:hypothetical protein